MQISLVALAALIVLVSAISRGQISMNLPKAPDEEPQKEEIVVDSEVEGIEDELNDLEDVLTESNDDTPEATNEPVLEDVVYTNALSEYVYPGSEILSQSDSLLELSSGDDTDKITDWYKDTIRKNGFIAKNFVSTKTNGEVLNKLEAAGEDIKISIEITKSPGSSATIQVMLTQ